jgi:L-ascorbate metabolism protein UlaG (beta-lactamase superfamily)
MVPVSIQMIGGPAVLLEIGGLRLLTDPAFDAPGPVPSGDRILTKTAGPAVAAEDVGSIDVVLLSHDQHGDNLDRSGRALLARAGVVLTPLRRSRPAGGRRRRRAAAGSRCRRARHPLTCSLGPPPARRSGLDNRRRR